MKSFLLAFLVTLTTARPEPPAGYSYPNPSSGVFGEGANGSHDIGASSFSSSSIGAHSLGGGSVGGGIGGSENEFGPSSGISSGSDTTTLTSGRFGGNAAAGPIIHKHIYVHVPADAPEEPRPPQVIPVAAPQKHYKIIFIKAPNPPTPTAPIISAQPQNEEKTLVYVLVKKPEEQPEIVVPTQAPTQPSKPEVYFIRYKTQKEAISGGHGTAVDGIVDENAGVSGGDVSGAELSGHGADISGDGFSGGHSASFSGAGSSDGSSGANSENFALADVSSKYGPPGYQK